jgi:hypothetical protein
MVLVLTVFNDTRRSSAPEKVTLAKVIDLAQRARWSKGLCAMTHRWNRLDGRGGEYKTPEGLKQFSAQGRLTDAMLERLNASGAFTRSPRGAFGLLCLLMWCRC